MGNPTSTRRIKKNEGDLRLMKVREELAALTEQLAKLPEAPKDAQRTAERATITKRVASLRQELMASLGATKRL